MDSSTDSKLFEKEEVPTFDQLLNNLTDEEVSTLSQYTDKLEFVPGETIFYQNEPGDSVFIIQRGKVEISKMTDEEGKEYVPFVTLEEGNIFGEMSFLVSRPTSASAVASEHTVLYQITRESFDEIIEEHPHLACQIYQAICKILVYRLNRTDEKVTKIVQDMDEDMLEMHE